MNKVDISSRARVFELDVGRRRVWIALLLKVVLFDALETGSPMRGWNEILECDSFDRRAPRGSGS